MRPLPYTDAAFTFPAVRGVQASREYYVVMCPLKALARLFLAPAADLSPSLRAQRALNKGRIPQLARYVTDNPSSYVFSSLAASVDGEVHFTPASTDGKSKSIGFLLIPHEARFLINDGQHRLAALQGVLAERPELGGESISVVVYADAGLKRSQQMFADLNRHAVRPTRSLNVLYDHRDAMAELARSLSSSVPVFENMTEMAATTISNRERKLFTLNAIYHATQLLLGQRAREPVSEPQAKLTRSFWTEVGSNMHDWQEAVAGRVHPCDLRKTCVHAHGIALQAIAMAGHALLSYESRSWKRRLSKLSEIDWSRANTRLWEGRAMSGGKICKAGNHLVLTANVVRKALGVPLGAAETSVELAHESPRTQQFHRSEAHDVDAEESGNAAQDDRDTLPRRREALGNRV